MADQKWKLAEEIITNNTNDWENVSYFSIETTDGENEDFQMEKDLTVTEDKDKITVTLKTKNYSDDKVTTRQGIFMKANITKIWRRYN